jgi:hypothetical protein
MITSETLVQFNCKAGFERKRQMNHRPFKARANSGGGETGDCGEAFRD